MIADTIAGIMLQELREIADHEKQSEERQNKPQ